MTLVALMVSCGPKVDTPILNTSEVSEITLTSAQCGGKILTSGNSIVTERGVCWSTEQNPTVLDSHTNDGKGLGSFTSNLENLTENTTYYVRAYATITEGITTYGNEVSFTTLDSNYEEVETGEINGHAYVDLGLSVKWATCNVGANSPEEYGQYFAWGETSPKTEFTEENSLTNKKHMEDFSGDEQYDAAAANWGGGWRMATSDEYTELINDCTWILVENEGYKVTGPNGNSIFIPTSGFYNGSSLDNSGTYSWSSTPCNEYDNDVQSKAFCIYADFIFVSNLADRYVGATVRPVVE